MLWISVEWLGAILGLSGSLMMASNKVALGAAWGVWIMSNICLMALFAHTSQYGLFSMSLMGLFTSILGLWQWSHKKDINIKAMQGAFFLGKVGMVLAGVLLLSYPWYPHIRIIEWFGSILSITGALLLASKHDKAAWCWIAWSISNMVLLCMSIYLKQWGFAMLQLGFTLSNIYGCFMWIYMKKKTDSVA